MLIRQSRLAKAETKEQKKYLRGAEPDSGLGKVPLTLNPRPSLLPVSWHPSSPGDALRAPPVSVPPSHPHAAVRRAWPGSQVGTRRLQAGRAARSFLHTPPLLTRALPGRDQDHHPCPPCCMGSWVLCFIQKHGSPAGRGSRGAGTGAWPASGPQCIISTHPPGACAHFCAQVTSCALALDQNHSCPLACAQDTENNLTIKKLNSGQQFLE